MAVLVVGVPKEIKDKEGRVSVQPDGVAELAYHGRRVVVQASTGSAAGFRRRVRRGRHSGGRHRRIGVRRCGLDRQGQGAHT
jgi:hypothetical protein